MSVSRTFLYEIDGVRFNFHKLDISNSGTFTIMIPGFLSISDNECFKVHVENSKKIKNSTNILLHWDSGSNCSDLVIFNKYKEKADLLASSLTKIINMALEGYEVQRLNIIGHSLGARIIVNGLQLNKKLFEYPLKKVILLGAAVDWPYLPFESLRSLCVEFYNFYSTSDSILSIKPDGEKNIGKYGLPCKSENMYNIKCLEYGHTDYWDNLPELLTFIRFDSKEKITIDNNIDIPILGNDFREEYSDESFWDKVKVFAKTVGRSGIQSALELYYVLQNPNVSLKSRAIIYGSLGYFISPLDVIPDFTPIVGYSDDIAILAAALSSVAYYIDESVKLKSKQKLSDWFDS